MSKYRVHLKTGRYEEHKTVPHINDSFIVFQKTIPYNGRYSSVMEVIDKIYPADIILYIERIEDDE